MHIKMNTVACVVYSFGYVLVVQPYYFMACINIKYHSMSSNILTSFVFKNSTAHYHRFQFISRAADAADAAAVSSATSYVSPY